MHDTVEQRCATTHGFPEAMLEFSHLIPDGLFYDVKVQILKIEGTNINTISALYLYAGMNMFDCCLPASG